MAGSRQDTYSVRVRVNGEGTGVWDKMSGGAVDSEETKYRPGGLGDEVSLGGHTTTENVTVTRLYDLDRDHNGLVRKLLNGVGKSKVVVTKQPLDNDGVPFGKPLVYRGILKSCTPPDVDSESTSAGLLAIEVSTAGTVN
jgi:hypothetical protein